MARVTFENATRIYPGSDVPAVDGLDLEVEDGEFMVLVGPSGCGKSTTLRMLAGLEGIDGGTISIGSRDVTHVSPRDRDVAMVFQNYALYPHMTVRQNIGFHLKIAKMPAAEIKSRVEEAARLLALEEFLDRKPAKLSGGQRQRVAMGRAVVREPAVFLMDEPLSNLDAQLRASTRTQIASLQRRLGTTTVYVTHDQVEAMTMGDRVAVLKDGVLQQCGTPGDLYRAPANRFVAGFIGSPGMNMLTATVQGENATVAQAPVPLTAAERSSLRGPEVGVGVRPDGFSIVSTAGASMVATVEVVEELGSDAYAYCSLESSGALGSPVVVRVDAKNVPSRGSRLGLAFKREDLHLFHADTGERLPA
jgi:multiple sugar transport system ATP-binding protein